MIMKNFVEYLTESKKTYDFKIGVAGEYADNCVEDIKSALEKYGLVKLTDGKRTPINKKPLDFPQLENIEVTYFEAEVNYPTTQQVMQEYLGQCCCIPQSNIIVRDLQAPQEEYQEDTSDGTYEPLMDTEDMGGESAQGDVAGNRVMDLLKELETARKEREHEPTDGVPQGESADISEEEQTKSVVGS